MPANGFVSSLFERRVPRYTARNPRTPNINRNRGNLIVGLSRAYLNRPDIVLIQSKVWIVATVKGRHQSTLDVAVTQAERVPELVGRDLKEIGTAVTFDGPSFGVVEVSIATVHGKVRVRQGAAGSIERITVAVLAYLESDFDVNLNESNTSP